MPIGLLQVIWIRDEFIRPPGPKMVVCVEAELGCFFRINTEAKWPVPVALNRSDHAFLQHDSYLQVGQTLELSDYIIEASLESRGLLGSIDRRYILRICAALARSHTISASDKQAIGLALGCNEPQSPHPTA